MRKCMIKKSTRSAIKLKAVYSFFTFCLGLTLHAADTNRPVVLSAASFDGQTIGVCFSEALDPVSATNLANYHIFDTGTWFRLASTNFPIVEASLRPDQRSVVLKLLEAFPGTV